MSSNASAVKADMQEKAGPKAIDEIGKLEEDSQKAQGDQKAREAHKAEIISLFKKIADEIRKGDNEGCTILQTIKKDNPVLLHFDELGRGLIHIAAKYHREETIKYLVEVLWVEPTLRSKSGNTPLEYNLENPEENTYGCTPVRQLKTTMYLEYVTSAPGMDWLKFNRIANAIREDDRSAEELLKKIDKTHPVLTLYDELGRYLIHIAAKYHRCLCVERLVKHLNVNPNLESTGDSKKTALQFSKRAMEKIAPDQHAALACAAEMNAFLSGYAQDAKEKDEDRMTTPPMAPQLTAMPEAKIIGEYKNLLLAVYEGDLPRVEKLLAEEKEGRAAKSDYNELLRVALSGKYFAVAQKLIDAGADVNDASIAVRFENPLFVDEEGAAEFLIKNKFKFSNKVFEGLLQFKKFNTAQKLIDCRVPVNVKHSFELKEGVKRYSLLEYHCFFNPENDLTAAEFLLKNKADVNYYLSQPLIFGCFEKNGFNYKKAELLIRYGLNVNDYGKLSYNALLLAINRGDVRLVRFLCENKANVHLPYKHGDFPLLVAIKGRKFDVARVLIEFGANVFLLPLNILQELRNSKNLQDKQFYGELMAIYVKQLSQKEKIEALTLEEIKNIPFHELKLNAAIMEAIKNRIQTLLREKPLEKPLVEKLFNTLDHWEACSTQFKLLHPFNIIAEVAELLHKPELIDQEDTKLCGPAALLTTLVKSNPQAFVGLALELLTKAKTEQPLKLDLSKHSKNEATAFAGVLMTEIRRASNFTGYSPTSVREEIQGVTNPRVLCDWLQTFGFQDVEDLSFMMNHRGAPLAKPLHMLLDIVFYGFHKDKETSLSQVEILQKLSAELNRGKQVILFLSEKFMDAIEKLEFRDYPEVEVRVHHHANFGCCVPIDHYAYLNKLREVGDNIEFEVMTYGKIFSQTLSKEEFLSGFRGAVLATAPAKLDQRLQLIQFELERGREWARNKLGSRGCQELGSKLDSRQ